MADIKSPEERSRNMAKIRSKDTKPEVWVRKKLFNRGYRYRKNAGSVPGHPDIWLKRYNTAIFVHGCFWHRHPGCRYSYMPKTRIEFWTDKFQKNIDRDERVKAELESAGIKMLVIWECTVKQMMKTDAEEYRCLKRIEEFLISDEKRLEL